MSDAAGQSERFTEGALLWPLLTLAAPLVTTQLLQTVYNLTDTFWVLRLGNDAMAALSYSWPVVFLLISVGGGMTAAGTILVSQNTGAENEGRVNFVAGQTLGFVTLLSLGLSIAGYLLTPMLLSLLGSQPGTGVHTMAVSYTRIVFLGLWFMFGFFVFQALLRGWGDTKTPMYLMTGSVALNVVIDPVFILGFTDNPLFSWLGLESLAAWLYAHTGFEGMGVAGAAIATVGSRGLAALAGFWLLFSGRVGITPSLSALRPELAPVRKIVRIGAPVSVEQSTQALSVTLMTVLIALVGDNAVAAYGVGGRFGTIVWLPMVGMGMAVETVVGQNLGAGRRDRARRVVYHASAILVAAFLVVSVVATLYARPIVGLFAGTSSGPVADHVVTFIHIVAPTYAVMAVFHMMNGAFHGAGATRLSMVLGLTTLWGFRAALAAILITVVGLGAVGAWYGIAASNVVSTLAATVCFLHGGWLGDSLATADKEPATTAEADAASDTESAAEDEGTAV